jgi:Predicted ATPase or kinase
MERIIIKNLEELDKLTKEIAKNLKGNEIILLEGDLGAGKTTFTKYLLKILELTKI